MKKCITKKYRSVKLDLAKPDFIVESFEDFLAIYQMFRTYNGLSKNINNVHEILTGMTDKHGRICRYIKHQERKDPKPDWPVGMTAAMTGYEKKRRESPVALA